MRTAGAEELLILCANAIKNRNGVVAKQAVHALQNISSLDGELPSERVTAYFLRALVLRAGSLLHDHRNSPLNIPTEDDDDDDLPPAQAHMRDNPSHRKCTSPFQLQASPDFFRTAQLIFPSFRWFRPWANWIGTKTTAVLYCLADLSRITLGFQGVPVYYTAPIRGHTPSDRCSHLVQTPVMLTQH